MVRRRRWVKLEGLPSARILRLYMETRSGKRELYIGTDKGLAVFRE